jgi:hypothetical protein
VPLRPPPRGAHFASSAAVNAPSSTPQGQRLVSMEAVSGVRGGSEIVWPSLVVAAVASADTVVSAAAA